MTFIYCRKRLRTKETWTVWFKVSGPRTKAIYTKCKTGTMKMNFRLNIIRWHHRGGRIQSTQTLISAKWVPVSRVAISTNDSLNHPTTIKLSRTSLNSRRNGWFIDVTNTSWTSPTLYEQFKICVWSYKSTEKRHMMFCMNRLSWKACQTIPSKDP